MNFLITGATGFLGRPLAHSLLNAGHGVNYLARQRSNKLNSRAAFFCWKADDEPPLNCVNRLDAIIHLAGEPIMQRWNAGIRERIWDSRVLGTRRLVQAIAKLKHKPAALVSASAVGYFGDRGDEILTEASPRGTGFLADLCAQWETEAYAARESGLRVIAIRIGVVLGSGGGALKAMLPIFRAGLGGRLGSGKQWMSWIGARDLLSLFVFAATTPALDGVLNAVSPHPVTNADFTRTLGKSLRRPAILPVPRLALRLALGEVGEYLLDSARVLPEAAQRAGFRFDQPDLATCLEEILKFNVPQVWAKPDPR